jgi:GNAT superfamily N-acetyltransferase
MKTAVLSQPVPISEEHEVEAFDCGENSLNDWLKKRALKNARSGASLTYVVLNGREVIGYYCLSAGSISHAIAPKAMLRNMPDPIPVLVLGRLAIHKQHQNHGLGSAMLRDATIGAIKASRIIGVAALLTHALSEPGKRFYLSRGFIESPIKPMTLCLMLATAKKILK